MPWAEVALAKETGLPRLYPIGAGCGQGGAPADAALDKPALQRMATAAHDGLARSLVPSHTPLDGDLVFAVSTGARALSDPVTDAFGLGHAAACVLARAVARGVHAASQAPGDLQPCWRGAFG